MKYSHYQDHLSALIHEPSFRQVFGDAQFTKARLIKDLGNLAGHSTRKIALDEELKKLREEFAAAKKVNSAQADTQDYSKAETRDYFIDLLLKESGYELDEKNFEIEVSGMLASAPLSQRNF